MNLGNWKWIEWCTDPIHLFTDSLAIHNYFRFRELIRIDDQLNRIKLYDTNHESNDSNNYVSNVGLMSMSYRIRVPCPYPCLLGCWAWQNCWPNYLNSVRLNGVSPLPFFFFEDRIDLKWNYLVNPNKYLIMGYFLKDSWMKVGLCAYSPYLSFPFHLALNDGTCLFCIKAMICGWSYARKLEWREMRLLICWFLHS